MYEASWVAAAITGIFAVIVALLSLRGSIKANQLNATAKNLDAQLSGWQARVRELSEANAELRRDMEASDNRLRARLVESEENAASCKRDLEQAQRDLWRAQRRISVLEDRLEIPRS